MTYEEFAEEWDNNSEISCHTSGSTGTPKSILLPKEQMEKSARRTADFFHLDSDSILYSCISPDYIGGKIMLARQRVLNCTLLWETPSNSPLSNCNADRISLLSIVPSQMGYILDNRDNMPVLENILIGGSSIPASLRERIAGSGMNVYESYGMTETSSHIALRKVSANPAAFKTLGDITVDTVDDALRINLPGWQTIVTNDNAQVFSPTEFRILGRLDNVIISGGIKINPESVEEILSRFIDIPFYISSIPDDKWGQILVLIAEGNASDKERIEAICRLHLPKYHLPKRILFLPRIPRSPNGKILRHQSPDSL